MIAAAVFALALWGAGGCAPKVPGDVDPFVAALASADARWEARSATGNVDEAERAYTALLAERPQSGDVLWRLSRLYWSRAWIDPGQAETWHEVGREQALRCLAADPGIADAITRQGDRLDAGRVAAASVPAECAALAASHVAALADLRGAGAALDLEDVDALLAAPRPATPEVAALGRWADGVQIGRAHV